MTTLYHYCSTSTFLSIIAGRSIRLSSLSLSNDTMEGKLLSKILSGLARQDGLDKPSTEEIQNGVGFLETWFHGLGFCLSEEGDLLSQWRGYAADATGFSIGFSKNYLLSLSASIDREEPLVLKGVEYDASMQVELIRPAYDELKKNIQRLNTPTRSLSALEADSAIEDYNDAQNCLHRSILDLAPSLFSLKSAAFREEMEWRLIAYSYPKDISCSYHPLDDRLVPYRMYALAELGVQPVTEVIVGPKNQTPVLIIKNLLEQHGHQNVMVKQSTATYR